MKYSWKETVWYSLKHDTIFVVFNGFIDGIDKHGPWANWDFHGKSYYIGYFDNYYRPPRSRR